MPDSGNFDLFGRIVIVVASDNSVVGTLENGSRRFEIRGELSPTGVFRGVLDGPGDYNVSGTILTSRNQAVMATWTIDGPGDEDDSVQFQFGDC
jgi:hypothetical protein